MFKMWYISKTPFSKLQVTGHLLTSIYNEYRVIDRGISSLTVSGGHEFQIPHVPQISIIFSNFSSIYPPIVLILALGFGWTSCPPRKALATPLVIE